MNEKIICCSILICCCSFCIAQQVVSAGGYTEKPEISVNWILGGGLSAISVQNSYTITQVQDEILHESGITLNVYPTPVTDFINLEISPVEEGRLILELFDASGIMLLDQEFVNQPHLQVNISSVPCGIYFLKVCLPGQDHPFEIKKIVKI